MAFLGVDLGGSGIRVGVVDEQGNVTRAVREPHANGVEVEGVMAHLVSLVDRVRGGEPLEGLGVGIAAWVARGRGVVVSSPNLGWRDVALADRIRAQWPGVRAEVANDLKAIGWGEARFGAGRGAYAVFTVYVGTGVGSALVDGGRLILGGEGYAGEIGHVAVDRAHGRVCGCGQRGCLETFIGGRGFGLQSGDGASAADLETRADAGDERAEAILTRGGTLLGNAVGAAVMLTNPDVLVWGGGVWGSRRVREATERALREGVHPDRWGALRTTEATLGDLAGIVGAADLARQPR